MYNQLTKKIRNIAMTKSLPTVSISNYCAIPDQVAFVCRHFPHMIPGYHDHDCFEINYVQKGECINFVEGEVIYMPEGSFIVINTATFHTLYAPYEDSVVYNVLLDKEWLLQTIQRYPIPKTDMGKFFSMVSGETFPTYVFSKKSSDAIKDILNYQCEHRNEASILTEANILYCVNSMMNEKSSVMSSRQKSFDKTMYIIESYVNQNFNTVTLESLAAHIGYSPAHTGRLFKKHTKKSFSSYIKELKLKHAKYLLSFSTKPISEISEIVGYESPEHFCRTFKFDTGMSPKDYRQSTTKPQ